jgi:hypothetical protein
LSLEAVSQATRISVYFLMALEENRFDPASLLENFYHRSFIRQYFIAIGRDPQEVISAIVSVYGSQYGEGTNVDILNATNLPLGVSSANGKPVQVGTDTPSTAIAVSRTVFAVLEVIVPKRLAREELGDAEEYINRRGTSSCAIYLKMGTTVFWSLINATRELIGALRGARR